MILMQGKGVSNPRLCAGSGGTGGRGRFLLCRHQRLDPIHSGLRPSGNDLGKFFDPHHPAVLLALKIATDAAHKAGTWIGICGELGADLTLLETFLAIGINELSVSPSSVLPLRAEIRKSIAKTCTLKLLEC